MLLSTFSNRVVGLPKNEVEVEKHSHTAFYLNFIKLPVLASTQSRARLRYRSRQDILTTISEL